MPPNSVWLLVFLVFYGILIAYVTIYQLQSSPGNLLISTAAPTQSYALVREETPQLSPLDSPQLKSTIECVTTTRSILDRQCVYHNFCVAPSGAVFPRYSLDLSASTSDNGSFDSQISTFVDRFYEEGVMWSPDLEYNPNNTLEYTNLESRHSLLVYAPCCWASKFPYHNLMNHILPIFRALENIDPTRRNPYPNLGNVFKYNVDLLASRLWETPPIQGPSEELLTAIGGEMLINQNNDNSNMLLGIDNDTVYCYEDLHGGVGGVGAQFSYENPYSSKWVDTKIFSDFRQAILHYDQGCPWGKFPWTKGHRAVSGIPQRLRKKPLVVLLQRINNPGSNANAYGPRIFTNESLKAMDEELLAIKEIEYHGHTILTHHQSPVEQICAISQASILVGIHGNALALLSVMEQGTSVIEMHTRYPQGSFPSLAASAGIHYYSMNPKRQNAPEAKEVAELVKRAVKRWKIEFNIEEGAH